MKTEINQVREKIADIVAAGEGRMPTETADQILQIKGICQKNRLKGEYLEFILPILGFLFGILAIIALFSWVFIVILS